MIRYQADWVLPIAGPPIRRGALDVERGRVVRVGPAGAGGTPVACRELGRQVILPSLVNAHTHLELSGLDGVVPPATSMSAWVETLFERRAVGGPPDPAAIRAAVTAIRDSGTGLVGDIGNTLAAVPLLRGSPLSGRVFREVVGFPEALGTAAVEAAVAEVAAVPDTGRVRPGLAAHAPYSVGPTAFRALGRAIGDPAAPRSVHLGESPEELEFLSTGGGPWRALLERLGRWDPAWAVPGCGPVAYLERLGWLVPGLLAVHGVQLTDVELARLREAGATVVTCPRSNRWTGVGDPPVARFDRSGVRLAVGTDSLASAPDLNLFSELARLRELAPGVRPRRWLECATREGARALGFGAELGELAPGRRASAIAVRLPAGIDDVEEYLVGGIRPDAVTWLDPDDGPAP